MPFHDDEKLRDWMYNVYVEKDKILGMYMDIHTLTVQFRSDNYYKTGEFHPGERGTLIVFPWSKIIGQYAFWFISFFVQLRVYKWLLSSVYYFFFPV